MNFFVLAGGPGTRLKAVLPAMPKALAPVGEVPFLQLQIQRWVQQGLTNFTFLLHHKADQIINLLRSLHAGPYKNCQFNWLVEPAPMDTGGAVSFAVKELRVTGDFLLTNADTWLGGGIAELTLASAPAIAVVDLQDTSRYGQVQFDDTGYVTAFTEKNISSSSGWINAGLCRLSAQAFEDWNGKPYSLERELFPKLVAHRQLRAIPLKTDFIDIGIPTDYQRFCRWFQSDREHALCS